MDRIIEVKVRGNHLTSDNNIAGIQYEGNVTRLRMDFDEGWDGYAKTVVFFNAYGQNPVKRVLTADLLEDIVKSTRIYLCPIPPEPLAYAGTMEYVIEGYLDGKRQRALQQKMKVTPSPYIDDAGEPADPTPSQAEQIQGQIDRILADMQTEVSHAEIARTGAETAQAAAENAQAAAVAAKERTEDLLEDAEAQIKTVLEGLDATAESVPFDSDTPVIEKESDGKGNVTLHFNVRQGEQGESGVYVGDGEMPENCNVQIIPTGEGYTAFPYMIEGGTTLPAASAEWRGLFYILQTDEGDELYICKMKDGEYVWEVAGATEGGTLPDVLPMEQGGTGATTAADARTNLDVYSKKETDDKHKVMIVTASAYDNDGNGKLLCTTDKTLKEVVDYATAGGAVMAKVAGGILCPMTYLSVGAVMFGAVQNAESYYFVMNDLGAYMTSTSLMPKTGGTITGVVNAPTAAAGTNDEQIATTAFVQQAIASIPTGVTQVFHIGTTAPEDTNLLWIDTANGLKYHNGTEWVTVPVAYN